MKKGSKAGPPALTDGRRLPAVLPPDAPPPRVLDPKEALRRDLTLDPPDGFPPLSTQQAALVKRRLERPTETWTDAWRAAGFTTMFSSRNVAAAVRMYVAACTAFQPPKAKHPSELRQAAVDRLARVVEAGDDRDAVTAAKVLEGFLPPLPKEDRPDLAKLSEVELVARLTAILTDIDLAVGISTFKRYRI